MKPFLMKEFDKAIFWGFQFSLLKIIYIHFRISFKITPLKRRLQITDLLRVDVWSRCNDLMGRRSILQNAPAQQGEPICQALVLVWWKIEFIMQLYTYYLVNKRKPK
jgi:hypothetical protein